MVKMNRKVDCDAMEELDYAAEDEELELMMMMGSAPAKSYKKEAMMAKSRKAPEMMMASAKSNLPAMSSLAEPKSASDDKYLSEAVKCTVKQVKKKQAAYKMMI